jgi:glycosyltransferase involved in cell wall biosynthesis
MRVALVSGICTPHDAISSAVVTQATILASEPSVSEVIVVSQFISSDLPCASYQLDDPWRLVSLCEELSIDAAVFHFGIRYELFNALWLLDGSPTRCAVHFHNVTPPHLAEAREREGLEASLIQAQLLPALTLPVWTYSDHNRHVLLDWGVAAERIRFVPLLVEAPRRLESRRATDIVRLLTVGRIVPAKGVHVLVDALTRLLDRGVDGFELRLAGNVGLSSSEYSRTIEQQVASNGLASHVQFVGQPSDEELWSLYEETDVVISPSLHEGLCIPIIEGYLAGCRAIGTDAGNLSYVVCPPDPIARANDSEAMANAIEATIDEVRAERARGAARLNHNARRLCEQFSRDSVRRHLMQELTTLRS